MTEIIEIGRGDAAGGEEVLLVKLPDSWLLIVPWGMDYGCGFSKVVSITDEEKDMIVEKFGNSYINTDDILTLFVGREDLLPPTGE